MTNVETNFTLYRFFGHDDQLLYVGLTINPGRRFQKHMAEKPWWTEVAKVTMEQHPDLAALRAAEAAAIKTEHPLHNVRMNGTSTSTSAEVIEQEEAVSGSLVGMFFHSWREARDEESKHATFRNGRVLEWQGRVVQQLTDELFLIELFSWWDGDANGQQLARVADMGHWTFYNNATEMQASLNCREDWGRYGGLCGRPCEYVTFGGTVCARCASTYSTARKIIWKDNKVVGLGKPESLPHWTVEPWRYD